MEINEEEIEFEGTIRLINTKKPKKSCNVYGVIVHSFGKNCYYDSSVFFENKEDVNDEVFLIIFLRNFSIIVKVMKLFKILKKRINFKEI